MTDWNKTILAPEVFALQVYDYSKTIEAGSRFGISQAEYELLIRRNLDSEKKSAYFDALLAKFPYESNDGNCHHKAFGSLVSGLVFAKPWSAVIKDIDSVTQLTCDDQPPVLVGYQINTDANYIKMMGVDYQRSLTRYTGLMTMLRFHRSNKITLSQYQTNPTTTMVGAKHSNNHEVTDQQRLSINVVDMAISKELDEAVNNLLGMATNRMTLTTKNEKQEKCVQIIVSLQAYQELCKYYPLFYCQRTVLRDDGVIIPLTPDAHKAMGNFRHIFIRVPIDDKDQAKLLPKPLVVKP